MMHSWLPSDQWRSQMQIATYYNYLYASSAHAHEQYMCIIHALYQVRQCRPLTGQPVNTRRHYADQSRCERFDSGSITQSTIVLDLCCCGSFYTFSGTDRMENVLDAHNIIANSIVPFECFCFGADCFFFINKFEKWHWCWHIHEQERWKRDTSLPNCQRIIDKLISQFHSGNISVYLIDGTFGRMCSVTRWRIRPPGAFRRIPLWPRRHSRAKVKSIATASELTRAQTLLAYRSYESKPFTHTCLVTVLPTFPFGYHCKS